MGCGRCKKKSKKFAHTIRKIKRKAAKQSKAAKRTPTPQTPLPKEIAERVKNNIETPKSKPSKKKRGHSKRGLWLKKKRREAKKNRQNN